MSNDHLRVIRNALKENHDYDELPEKAVHKLSYLVYKKSEEKGANVAFPHFWYRYGILTQSPDSAPADTQSPLDPTEKEIVDKTARTVLKQYYETSLEDITDITYKDAPYEVFGHWRELDKQISELEDKFNPFFDTTPIREEVEDKIEAVYDSFPVSAYPEHEGDLSTWYFALTRELDMELEDIQRLHQINKQFWGIFTLSVAREHRYHLTEEDVLQALGLSSFESALQQRRHTLHSLENEARMDRLDGEGDGLTPATDAVMRPVFDSVGVVHDA